MSRVFILHSHIIYSHVSVPCYIKYATEEGSLNEIKIEKYPPCGTEENNKYE
jgi:hypothetical protein